MKNKRIVYINTFSRSHHHLQYNTGLLMMCKQINNNLAFKGYESAFLKMLSLGDLDENTFSSKRYFSECPTWGKISLLIHYLYGAFLNIFILVTSKKQDLLIYNFNNVFSTYLINYLNHYLKRNILISCHGEMEFLITKDESSGYLAKAISKLVRSFFKRRQRVSKYILYCVCGNRILSNIIVNVKPEFINQFITVDHPYICDTNVNQKGAHPRTRMGLVGVISEKKGLKEFLNLVKGCKDNSYEFDFSVTGSSDKIDKDVFLALDIDVPPGYPAPLSTLDFESRIQELDVILFFYPSTSYKATASGALYDAINAKRIILGFQNDYFNYVFEKFGSFGVLCRDPMEMLQKLPDIVELVENNNINFDSIQRAIHPFSLTQRLRTELISKGFI